MRARVHADRERRHGEGWGILPDDREEGDSRAEYRHRESHSDDLSGGFGGSFFAVAGGCVSGYGRFWARVSQQRGDERDGHPTAGGDYGDVRGGRRISAGNV